MIQDSESGSRIRPELQALRALAVILVVSFHLWPDVVPGGYIGVDVFFVLSGFLITSHLAREVARTGTVSLRAFWARRIRRLLPASFTVLLASLAAMAIWLPRSIWQQTMQEVGAATLYIINWLLAVNAVDYMAADNSPSLVQHYWSLAVEEQFYVVWPVLMVVAIATAAAVAPRAPSWISARARPLPAVGVALGVVAVVSFVASAVGTERSQPVAYLISPTRAWEFAAGGLLALVQPDRGWPMAARAAITARALAAWAGIVMICGSAALLSTSSPFPGTVALLPVVGTVLVIWAGNVDHAWAPTAIAGFGPIQLLGDVSYGVYLWHWPLILLYPVLRGHDPELKGGLLVFGAAIVLAILTKYAVEDPVRRRAYWTASLPRTYALAGALMTVTLAVVGFGMLRLEQDRQLVGARVAADIAEARPCYGAAAMEHPGQCPDRFAVPADFDPAFGSSDVGPLDAQSCRAPADDTGVVTCSLGVLSSDVRIAVVGNSHAGSMGNGLAAFATSQGWRLDSYIKLDCMGVTLEQVAGFPTNSCITWTRDVIDRLASDAALDLVVFQSYYKPVPPAFDAPEREAYKEAVRRTWSRLVAAGKQVVVISDVPGTRPNRAPDCVATEMASYDPCDRPLIDQYRTNLLLEVARATGSVAVVDVLPYFCDAARCHAMIGGVVVYRDADHMTDTYAVTLGRFVGSRLATLLSG